MPKTPDLTRDQVLKRLLSTPPKPFTPKAKAKLSRRSKSSKEALAKLDKG